jgi:hypothetical protein
MLISFADAANHDATRLFHGIDPSFPNARSAPILVPDRGRHHFWAYCGSSIVTDRSSETTKIRVAVIEYYGLHCEFDEMKD